MSNVTEHSVALPTPEQLRAPWIVGLLVKRWGIAAAVFSAVVVVGLVLGRNSPVAYTHFLRAYLVGFMLCLGLTIGSLALLMLQHVTGGKWGLVMRRIWEAASRNLPLQALMFLPIAFGVRVLYPWTNPSGLTAHGVHAVHVREVYLNTDAFLIRAAMYFIGWGIFVFFLNRWSPLQDVPQASLEEANRLRLRFMRLSGGGLFFYALSVTLAVVDWIMSLDAVWYSTIYGMMYMVSQALVAMSFAILVIVMLAKYEPMRSLLRKVELHDNGKLLLAFVMLYTYLSFSQFIIIWSANLKEEIPWYLARVRNGWKPLFIVIFFIHFVAPFLLLLNRKLKRHGPQLAAVALLLIVARYLDLYWHILPNFSDVSWPDGFFHPTLWDLFVPAAMVSIWIAAFFWQLGRRPILPVYHPLVPQILERSHGAH